MSTGKGGGKKQEILSFYAHILIQLSLLGSYACFITTSLATVDTYLLLILWTTCQVLLTAAESETVSPTKTLCSELHSCTVLYKVLNMCMWQVSLSWPMQEPDQVCVCDHL